MSKELDEFRTVRINDGLSKKVLARLGMSTGEVRVSAEQWDLGFCETCSYPENGFAVYVDNKLVWPSDDYLNAFGGYIYADENGYVDKRKLSAWGVFFEWLDGKSMNEIRRAYYDLSPEDEDWDDEEEFDED